MTPIKETNRDYRLRMLRQWKQHNYRGHPGWKIMLDQYSGMHFFIYGKAFERNEERRHKK